MFWDGIKEWVELVLRGIFASEGMCAGLLRGIDVVSPLCAF